IGARAETMDDSFFGSIDELAVYSRALRGDEIAAIYNAANSGKCRQPIPPFITAQPTNRTIYVGSNTTFITSSGGDAPLSYQWLFEGSPLAGRTLSFLSLANVQFSNAGNYSLVISNLAGSITSSNALLTVNPLPPCASPAPGLVSWWRGEGDLTDNWGPNDGGTPPGTISMVSGKVGRAFLMGGSYIPVSDSPSLRLTNGMTIEAWVQPASSGSARTILTKFDPPGVLPSLNNSYYLGMTNSGQLCVSVSSNGVGRTTLIAPQALILSQWTHVAATYDGAMLRLYTNGTVAAQLAYSGGIFAGSDNLAIGASPLNQSGFTFPWSGLLDEVSLYNRGLSDSEILAIYNADLSGKCTEPPAILAQPASQTIPQGEDVKFSVTAVGTKPLKYQWRFGSTNILAATNSYVVLEKIQTNQAGNYFVVVSNLLGMITSAPATLTLTSAPTCVQVPSNALAWWPANGYQNDIVGTNNVSVSVFPTPTLYATGKVGQAFNHDGFASRLLVASSPSLNFGSNADFSIEGWIKAISPFEPPFRGSATTNPLVPLIEKRSFIGNSGIGYSFLLNQGRLSFGLSSVIGTNFPTFISSGPDLRDAMFHHVAVTVSRNDTNGGKLYVDGQEMLTFNPTLQRGSLSNSASLSIGSVTTIFSNSIFRGLLDEMTMYGRALSSSEILSIRQTGAAGKCLPPPTILVQPTNVLVNVGGSANFSVLASGVPTLTYQWRKNGTNIVSTASIFRLVGITLADAGTYKVVVSSPAGSSTSTEAILTVNQPPLASNLAAGTKTNTPLVIAIDKLLASATDPDGDPLSLSVVSGTSTNGGSVVRGADSVTYTPQPSYIGSDRFTYTVADGRGGSASAFVLIQVRDSSSASANMFPPSQVTGGFVVSFAGIPGRAYTLQRADNPSGPWATIASVTVGSDGIGTYTDTNAPPTSAYYRTTYP
ncbi:MAG TPA: LamG-like jellyroll fold domain-containing protein, partial [Candidatus Dormibacteraeota bacterium]|nr:LamG-like jellyroll fold domain-containing protein [Candidatus Dormibacteraeota bacterium]